MPLVRINPGVVMRRSQGFYGVNTGFKNEGMLGAGRSVADLDAEMYRKPNQESANIVFTADAKVIFVACSCGTDETAVAQRLTLLTGVTTVASMGAMAPAKGKPGFVSGGGWWEWHRVKEDGKWAVKGEQLSQPMGSICPVEHLSRDPHE
jgi:hypothetical protein